MPDLKTLAEYALYLGVGIGFWVILDRENKRPVWLSAILTLAQFLLVAFGVLILAPAHA